MILDGTLQPGERIDEVSLCAELGISRTPLREAIKVLAFEGLVQLMPNQGSMVTELTAEDVEAMFEMMEALEFQVGHLIASRATDAQIDELRSLHEQMIEFHRNGRRSEYFDTNQQIHLLLAKFTGNRFLAADYEKYLAKIRRARYLANLTQSRWDESAREHDEIIAALTARDGENLGGILREHSRRTGVIVIAAVKALCDPAHENQDSDSAVVNKRAAASSGS
ncbi:MAG: GntR family transcriptional regulator [Alphaproteobacteria bacterium]|nr:GntR family transcriptional regulator [Alphaproteobacteria bacterium]